MRTTPTPLNIGQGPQLFFDNYMIEMVNFVTRTMHQPKKHATNPLLRKDKPWEQVLLFRTNTWNVHWDEHEQLFKCWYQDLDQSLEFSTLPRHILHPGAARMAYAES